jgi:hypothetical protein
LVEVIMRKSEPARPVEVLDLLLAAAHGIFPGPVLEKLIDRMERRP